MQKFTLKFATDISIYVDKTEGNKTFTQTERIQTESSFYSLTLTEVFSYYNALKIEIKYFGITDKWSHTTRMIENYDTFKKALEYCYKENIKENPELKFEVKVFNHRLIFKPLQVTPEELAKHQEVISSFGK